MHDAVFTQQTHGFHMASIKSHPSGGYRAFICVSGIRESKVLKTKRDAQQWAAMREAQLSEDVKKSPAEKHTLRGLFEKYRDEVSPTKRGARWEVVRINLFLRDPVLPLDSPVGKLDVEHLVAWRDARLKQVSPASVLRESKLISSMLEFAKREWRWISENQMTGVRKPSSPPHREVVISRQQIHAMLKALDHCSGPCKSTGQATARAFLLALRTGMRAGEITKLAWEHVKDDYCILPVTKTRPRQVPLVPQARRVIESMRGWDKKLVFGLSPQTLDATFRRHRDRAGLSGFVFHDARHTAATWIAHQIDVLDLCKMFGWSNPKQAMVYYNPSASEIAKALTRPLARGLYQPR